MKFLTGGLTPEFFDEICQSSVNDFENSISGGWVTNIRMGPCISDAIYPSIACLLINVTSEYECSNIFKQLLRDISGDRTLGIKFNTFSGAPKAIMDKLPTKDWTLKKVMQVEGERTKAQVSAKEIESFFKTCLLLGSRVQVVNTAITNWASKSKGRRALKEGMSTQIVLNEKLESTSLNY